MAIMGFHNGAGAVVLRLMACVMLARAITTTMSPLIIIAGRQGEALWLTALALASQFLGLILVLPTYGLIGASAALLAIELALSAAPVSCIGQRVTGARLNWKSPALICACAGASILFTELTPLTNGFAAAVLAATLYLVLVCFAAADALTGLRRILERDFGRQFAAADPVSNQVGGG